ncbi:MAG: AbrB/MazE/SpoVT family DNA-binding domain-containing protein [Terracidiphilus sp.]|jgi:AbrB family looped-hinge helix DNA binding protein
MPTATVTSKGQITIPIEVREALNLKTGEKVIFFPGEDGEFIVRRVGSIKDLRGCLAGLVPPMTVEEMDEAIGNAVTEDYLRSVGQLPSGDSVSDSRDEAA